MTSKFSPEKVKRFQHRQNEELVPVIAAYNVDGKIKPLKVRINGEGYDVISCVERISTYPVNSYICTLLDHGVMREVTLAFHLPETCWTILR